MFTGLVSDIGEVIRVEPRGNEMLRLAIACSYELQGIALGASIACGGPCLTVTGMGLIEDGRTWFEVDAAPETLARTTVGTWKAGTRINLERSLKLGDELGGHWVTGHVDGMARITERDDGAEYARFQMHVPEELAPFIAEKGSICLDGTSLTVNQAEGSLFSVLLIPHSLRVTTWGERREGDLVNLEVDLMARYVARLASARGLNPAPAPG
jgi:riboflavin synthase